jgi:pimeloyl-ACP methyl ester carboxylesterase
MTAEVKRTPAMFKGGAGNKLVADIYGEQGQPVLLMHGAGQTRHAWQKTAEMLVGLGYMACAVDHRGHGDSEWILQETGGYDFPDFAGDARALAAALTERTGKRPIAIGASLGGIASMLAEASLDASSNGSIFSALVLVDITPRVNRDGVGKVHSFMRANAQEGFASVDEAAESVAAYLPHRPRPRSNEGLKKNLRLHSDGRWRWHWDPRFLEGRRRGGPGGEAVEAMLIEAARRLTIPTLLVRGGSSELVQAEHVREMLELVPHASYADVTGARHMVVGDRNDQFASAIKTFLMELNGRH